MNDMLIIIILTIVTGLLTFFFWFYGNYVGRNAIVDGVEWFTPVKQKDKVTRKSMKAKTGELSEGKEQAKEGDSAEVSSEESE